MSMQVQTMQVPRPNVHRPESCLIIEDSSFDRRMMSRVLGRSFPHMSVSAVTTLAAARRHLALHGTSLILLDNQLPDGIGANFAMELSADTRFAHIPVILISDWPSPFMYDKAHFAGVRHVVDKSDFGARYIHDALRPVPRKIRRH
ncbi:response regulator [Sulfitobacter sp. D35]|uniref:response regulator n=1 Tax=Sulfitobacter sp. D35 TaxID=3083252 RepID=UPI00296F1968|nr:response regulator [Sulfitobacter sp. D35]MDW4498318.1 response regulator [Sulfitobacter sp. D35]